MSALFISFSAEITNSKNSYFFYEWKCHYIKINTYVHVFVKLKVNATELVENLEEMFARYYTYSDRYIMGFNNTLMSYPSRKGQYKTKSYFLVMCINLYT